MKYKFKKVKSERQPTELLDNRDGEHGCNASKAQAGSGLSFWVHVYKKVSQEDIEHVRILIEKCLLLHMTREEVMAKLVTGKGINPHVITLVWQRLEEDNPKFFSAYNVRLKLQEQIILFNKLLEKQYNLTHDSQPSYNGISNMPVNSAVGYHTQQPFLPTTYVEPVHYDPSYDVVNGVPAAGNIYPIQQKGDAPSGNQEMARESYEQYMFEPDEIGSVQLMTFDAAVPSNMHSVEGFQYLDGGCANFSDNLSSQYNLTTNLINNEDLAALGYQSSPFPHANAVGILVGALNECDIADYLIADAPYENPQNPNC
ncbi:hypothetical protein BVRB_3g052360 [Beta vulgaris subsp. vulgaris]|uniref:uncharacterized protein LOC104888281 isoform X1 n=1 Tax=Beta vulgaris subsp. vulgaris TaxID=3555 RepID=UPI00053F7A7F|nr:uncharacterized protein LOC104888281 isoform X1 [Beta vulgaris subsp. vulgaris]XP_010671498.1 uncharacterized protein LOC104888281 isoform X1 [Beta vulgaris subsp. vulgaris]XP_010671499.1 uncharacterized protein LOC104888281 isoform X1 [Beta vulgaris subsp. vulgaris]KMT16065.1 hypothetical protein BVRB_3g052360 [Beta vulgaris subsp. vulgaris]